MRSGVAIRTWSIFVSGRNWDSPGLWAPKYIGATPVGGYVRPDDLEISVELKNRLAAWQEQFNAQCVPERMMTEIERCGFDAEAINIAIQLSIELGPSRIVEYELLNENLLFSAGVCVAVFERPPAPANP